MKRKKSQQSEKTNESATSTCFCFGATGASGDGTDERPPEIENVELELAPISSVDLSDWQSVELDE